MPWTPAELNDLRDKWTNPAEWPMARLQEHFGKTKGSIIGAAQRYTKVTRKGLPTKADLDEDFEAALEAAARVASAEGKRAIRRNVEALRGPRQAEERRPTIFQLRVDDCRWPMWEGDVPLSEKRYCGAQATSPSSFCGAHQQRAFGRHA